MLKSVKNYRGCFSKDMLPVKPLSSECMVINLQDFFAGPGTHWVAMYTELGVYEYFDPFGVVPPDVVVKYMKKGKKEVFYNAVQIQHIDSITCGYFCIYYVRGRATGRKPVDILLDFRLHPESINEYIIKNFANTIA